MPSDLGPCAALETLIAATADVCSKPYRHAVISTEYATPEDYRGRIECRNGEGQRMSDLDLELEVYRSGADLNLTLAWADQPDRPMLWHGQHPVWMDADSGKRCSAPSDGATLEALARRLRALLA